jgi:transposase
VRHEHAAGIDVGDQSHWAWVESTPDGSDTVREFPAHTPGLRQLVAWLRHCAVTTVALEASGVYGQVLLLTLLEAGFTVVMTAPQFARQIKGRPKTDRRDCQWIQRLHKHGLLPPSSSPTRPRTPCTTTSASAPTWSACPASTSSGCRRPWN